MNTKFKKIRPKNERIYFSSGYVCNGHWIFKVEWLKNLKRTKHCKFIGLQNLVKKLEIDLVMVRMGVIPYSQLTTEINETTITELVERDLSCFRPLNLSVMRYSQKSPGEKTKKVLFNNFLALDREYSPALFFDMTTTALYKDDKNPVVILDKNKQVVALIMPMKHKG